MSPLKEHYEANETAYKASREELIETLKKFFDSEHPTVDVQWIFGRVKEIDSIQKKITRLKLKGLTDLDDIIGTTVVCHTLSDADRAIEVLRDFLPKKYKAVRSDPKRKKDGYNGHHFNFIMSSHNQDVPAEIQIKSVLEHSWSIQSHKYLYKTRSEGDADILAKTVSGILENCENLWELVKKTNKRENIPEGKLKEINDRVEQDVAQQTNEYKGKVTSGAFVAKAHNLVQVYGNTEKAQLNDLVEEEVRSIQKSWNDQHQNSSSIEDAKNTLEVLELAVKNIAILGLLAIKYSQIDLLILILNTFNTIVNLSRSQAGLVALLSVPAAALHNTYFHLGIYALKKQNFGCLKEIINHQIELNYQGRIKYNYIWSTGSIMAPEIIPSASLTFNRLRDSYVKDDERIKQILDLNQDEFLELACQFNMLFCIRAKQIEEIQGSEGIWVYPNFGRFYAERVAPLVARFLQNPQYSRFSEIVFDESISVFNQKTDQRIKKLVERGLGGGGFFWDSITGWNIS